MTEPASIVTEIAQRAQVASTPCGEGGLAWRRWGVHAADAPVVVLVHGGSGSWTHWIKTIPALEPRAEVWAVDLPGLGASTMPPEPLTPQTCAEILAGGLRMLIPAARRAHLVAFSFGAHVSTLAAAQLGDHIADFTITGCSALGLPPAPMDPFPRERSTMTIEQRREVHRRTLEILMFCNPARIDTLAVHIQAENIRQARFRSRTFAHSDDIKRGLAHVHVPLRSIWGEKDVIGYPSLDLVRAALSLHHPELDLRVIPDAGHWSMYEQPDAFNALLIEMLGL